MKYLSQSKYIKLLALALALILVAGIIISSCSKEPSGESLTVTVASDDLDVHKMSSADSKVLGQLPLGLEIEILEQKADGETTWGRIDKTTLPDGTTVKAGWIDLQLVRFPGEPEETEPNTEQTADTQAEPTAVIVNMGTVTASELNIRKGADSGYEKVGTYKKGDRIEILETKTVDGTVWGCTNLGWIGMGYVRMDGSPAPEDTGSGAQIISNGSTEVLGYGVVDLGELNVRLGPGTDYDKISTITQGIRYAYYQVSSVDGSWVRIEDGWVSTDYFYLEGTTADDAVTGTVTTDDLNIRTGPNTSFQSCGTLQQGDTIEVLAQVGSWGYTEKGWVFMSYVEPVEPTYTTGPCTVTRGLNIRSEPNADSEIVGTFIEGNKTTILEVDGNWGRTVQGWINLKYVEYD